MASKDKLSRRPLTDTERRYLEMGIAFVLATTTSVSWILLGLTCRDYNYPSVGPATTCSSIGLDKIDPNTVWRFTMTPDVSQIQRFPIIDNQLTAAEVWNFPGAFWIETAKKGIRQSGR